MPGALHDVKVLEIAQVMAIPLCGVLLSDMGADVVKLEPPWGDATRYTMLPVIPGESKSFATLNRGKRSVGLDIADERSRPALEALVRWADVLLVSLKSEDLTEYKIGYGDLRPLNPGMIYLEHVPLGHKGPMGGQGGYDLVVGGLSGLTALIGKERNGTPLYTQPAVLDLATGILSATAVSAALYARKESGEGQRIETSLLATGMFAQVNVAHSFPAVDSGVQEQFIDDLAELRAQGASYEEMQRLRQRTIRRTTRGNIYYRYYKTKDSFISIGCLSPALQQRFRDAIGVSDPRQDPGFDLGSEEGYAQMGQLTVEAEAVMQTRTTDEWLKRLSELKIPCAPVLFPEEAIRHPQVTENGYLVELQHEILGPYTTYAPPIRMDGTPTEASGPAPPLAKHTEEVLREVGIADDEIAALIENGVAGGRVLGS
ncbi:MAG: CoA transferase [Chloroflexi bacterium]|nr:CoA transferase [Chloroflexota bacterium]